MRRLYHSVTAFSLATLLFVSAIVPNVFAETHLYMNEESDFSLTIPDNWSMQEGAAVQAAFEAEIILYPDEFSVDNHDGEFAELAGLLGLDFVPDSPKIAIAASTGNESGSAPADDLPSYIVRPDELRSQNIGEGDVLGYYAEAIGTIPYSEILDQHTTTHSWGYEARVAYSMGAIDGEGLESYSVKEAVFVFDDGDVYLVSYSSPDAEYEQYAPVFDATLDSLIIKSVNVPEFGMYVIPIMVLSMLAVVVLLGRSHLMPRIPA